MAELTTSSARECSTQHLTASVTATGAPRFSPELASPPFPEPELQLEGPRAATSSQTVQCPGVGYPLCAPGPRTSLLSTAFLGTAAPANCLGWGFQSELKLYPELRESGFGGNGCAQEKNGDAWKAQHPKGNAHKCLREQQGAAVSCREDSAGLQEAGIRLAPGDWMIRCREGGNDGLPGRSGKHSWPGAVPSRTPGSSQLRFPNPAVTTATLKQLTTATALIQGRPGAAGPRVGGAPQVCGPGEGCSRAPFSLSSLAPIPCPGTAPGARSTRDAVCLAMKANHCVKNWGG